MILIVELTDGAAERTPIEDTPEDTSFLRCGLVTGSGGSPCTWWNGSTSEAGVGTIGIVVSGSAGISALLPHTEMRMFAMTNRPTSAFIRLTATDGRAVVAVEPPPARATSGPATTEARSSEPHRVK
jgi:hypothetical protein